MCQRAVNQLNNLSCNLKTVKRFLNMIGIGRLQFINNLGDCSEFDQIYDHIMPYLLNY